ncbi:hypothetical protein F4778DRAFT_681493 [Xylariomycetidae sp. FL2044]|nr:hypothetical protein F4778DRAFT_681493 [Xylariomycetidae sp. FL2044]
MESTMTALKVPKRYPTWLITGCSSGFGLAFTRLALAKGHNVIATSRNPDRTPELVDEIRSKGGQWVQLDAVDQNCGKVIEGLEAQGTAIDVLINSAGIGASAPVESFSEDDVRLLMETNFYGPYRLMRAAAPRMRKRRSGVIVNLSSGSGMEAINTLGVYGASKAALDGLTKTLHKEMKDFNVRVLLVSMGTFDTGMTTRVSPIAIALDPDYESTLTDRIARVLTGGEYKVPNDHLKAVQIMYDVIMGEGVGEGREDEMMLPLGRDMATRAIEVRDRINHMMEVFGDVCNSVALDKS